MTDEPRGVQPGVVAEVGKVALGFLSRHNILYLLSAMLMLLGCYLISMPYLFRYREIGGLVVLLGIINVYEAMVILTCCFIIRRDASRPECAVLLLVELLFLFDATFTINACMPVHFSWGIAIATASLALVFLKLLALEAGAGARVFAGAKAFLLLTAAFLCAFQSFLMWPQAGPAAQQWLSYMVWGVFGVLPLLLLLLRLDPDRDTGSCAMPWWRTGAFRRTAVCIALILVAIQVTGQTWVHQMPFCVEFLLPAAISIAVILPVMIPSMSQTTLDAVRGIALTIAFALALIAGKEVTHTVSILGQKAVLSPFRIAALFGAAAFLLMWRRERSRFHLHGLSILLAVAIMGFDNDSIFAFFHRPALAKVGAIMPVAVLWVLFTRSYAHALLVMTAMLGLTLKAIDQCHVNLTLRLEMLRWWPILALVLMYVMRRNRTRWQTILIALIFCIGLAGRVPEFALPHIIYYWCGLAAILPAAVWVRRSHIYTLLAYLVMAVPDCYALPIPRAAVHWGGVLIGAAFVLFALGFLLTRRSLRPSPPNVQDGNSVP
ncbi:MAG: hypothetical protein AB1696_02485 [Planctomycetota bacterium]